MKLADWLFESNVAPEQLRRMLGVRSRTTIHRYLTGERTPRSRVILKISEITCGRVQLADFLDEVPPRCATVVQIEGRTKLVFPWTERGGRIEAAERAAGRDPETWPSPPLAAAIETLGTRVRVTRSGRFLLDGRISDARRVVREANAIRSELGQPEVDYPVVRPRHE